MIGCATTADQSTQSLPPAPSGTTTLFAEFSTLLDDIDDRSAKILAISRFLSTPLVLTLSETADFSQLQEYGIEISLSTDDETLRYELLSTMMRTTQSTERQAELLMSLESYIQQLFQAELTLRQQNAVISIIEACFDLGEVANDVLRRAIQLIYLTPEQDQRAEFLIDLARRYQSGGRVGRANSLIQQAIPAALGISNLWDQLSTLSQLYRFVVQDQDLDEASYLESQLRNLVSEISEPQNQGYIPPLQETIRALVGSGNTPLALELSQTLTSAAGQLAAYETLTREFLTQGDAFGAQIALDSFFSLLETYAEPVQVARELIELSELYGQLGDWQSVNTYSTAAGFFLDQSDSEDDLLQYRIQTLEHISRGESPSQLLTSSQQIQWLSRWTVNNWQGLGDQLLFGIIDQLTSRLGQVEIDDQTLYQIQRLNRIAVERNHWSSSQGRQIAEHISRLTESPLNRTILYIEGL